MFEEVLRELLDEEKITGEDQEVPEHQEMSSAKNVLVNCCCIVDYPHHYDL